MSSLKDLIAQYNKVAAKPIKTWSGSKANLIEKINALRAKPGRKPSPFVLALKAQGLNPRSVRNKLRKAGLHAGKGGYSMSDAKVKAALTA